jgi:hypothetical protein
MSKVAISNTNLQSNEAWRTGRFIVDCRAHENDTLQLTNFWLTTYTCTKNYLFVHRTYTRSFIGE